MSMAGKGFDTGHGSSTQQDAGQQSTQLSVRPAIPGRSMGPGRELRVPKGSSGWQQLELPQIDGRGLAQALGWFSIGLGVAEIVAPDGLARLIGVRGNHRALLRAFGAREVASGIGILAQEKPAAAVWSRVAGDALDLACLAVALGSPTTRRGRLAGAIAAVAGVALLDVLCAQQLSSDSNGGAASEGKQGAVRVHHSLVVNTSPEEAYRFWSRLENLPRFMNHLESVEITGDRRSHWVARAPAGATIEWDAVTTEDRPGELIAWRSLDGADVTNAGSVRFALATGGRGTLVTVDFEYEPPGGRFASVFAKLFGEEPSQQVRADLRRFKQVMETGEVVVSDATRRGTGYMAQQPAQPAATGAER